MNTGKVTTAIGVCLATLGLALTSGCQTQPLAANAGEDVTLEAGGAAALSASASGGDGNYTFQWAPSTGLSDPTSAAPAASPDSTTTYQVTVTDGTGAIATATVTVTVEPAGGSDSEDVPPMADAGDDQTIIDEDDSGDEPVTLDGSGSMDTDGSIASYAWSIDGGTVATSAQPTVMLNVGAYTVTLMVTDDDGLTDTDMVEITVRAAQDLSPAADAGADVVAVDNDSDGQETVQLDGSQSTDPKGGTLTYRWLEDGTEIATGETPSVTLDLGEHMITLEVTNGDGQMDTDDVLVRVAPPLAATINVPATIIREEAGDDDVTLTATVTGGAEPYALEWTVDDTVTITQTSPTVSLPPGAHSIDLSVTDDLDNQVADSTDTAIILYVSSGETPARTSCGAVSYICTSSTPVAFIDAPDGNFGNGGIQLAVNLDTEPVMPDRGDFCEPSRFVVTRTVATDESVEVRLNANINGAFVTLDEVRWFADGALVASNAGETLNVDLALAPGHHLIRLELVGGAPVRLQPSGDEGFIPDFLAAHEVVLVVQPPDDAVIASVGGPVFASDGDLVNINVNTDGGSGSYTYAWEQILATSGAAVELSGADTSITSFTAPTPAGNDPLTLQFQVTVTDTVTGFSDTSRVFVVVNGFGCP